MAICITQIIAKKKLNRIATMNKRAETNEVRE